MKRLYSIFLFIIFILSTGHISHAAGEVKEADLAGSWYPRSGTALENQIKSYLDAANPEKIDGRIFAVIVPHAGYVYSGPVAAYGYKAIEGKGIKTVIILGFSHRKFFDGIAIYDKGAWRTPLGAIEIDEALAKDISAGSARIRFNPDLFRDENSVEMQIPFIQMALKGAKIVPMAFGTQDYRDAEILAVTLARILKDRDDVIIAASTDMSHYHPYKEANSIDQRAVNALNRLKAKELHEEARLGVCEMCGLMPVTALLLAAEMLGYNKIKALKYANSGDITGNKEQVVGYLSAAIYRDIGTGESRMLNATQRKRLLEIARESITNYVKHGKRSQFTEKDPLLNESLGAFVTLHEGGNLRGCIGNMTGSGPLYQTVADMAIEAATGDPRFQRLSPTQIDKIDVEISVLSPLKKVKSADEIYIPGHGVIVRSGFRSGVYLPQVAAETGWNKEEFLTSLCAHKAGLAPNAWKDPATEIYIFTAEVFGEKKGEQHHEE